MKTIKQAAKEYAALRCKSDIWQNEISRDFKAGVEFAQRWIPVEEELPKEFNSGFSNLVLTKNSFNNILLERYDFDGKCFNAVRYDAKETGDGQVSHWRPIERI